MAALNFLLHGRRKVTLAHFNHGTPGSDEAQHFVERKSRELNLELVVQTANKGILKNELEWRNARYDFFKSLSAPIVLAHHLDDAVEWWIFSSLRGQGKLIPVQRSLGESEILRPFLFFAKEDLTSKLQASEFVYDKSNADLKHARNRIRHNIIPEALEVNPGLRKTILNLYKRELGCD